jgi:two-component system alkaline phosphatase synthesis response regulator PhoP
MYRVFVLTKGESSSVPWAVEAEGLSYDVGTEAGLSTSANGVPDLRPDAVLMDLGEFTGQRTRVLVSRCRDLGLPVVGVLPTGALAEFDPSLNLDDFVLETFRPEELVVRLKQAIFRGRGGRDQKVIKVGDLVIDTERYEVSLAGKRVLLTYKEYQLLVLLASNPGKVYTRESLLSQLWRYDYFGGTRTVDVHIRRLRAKTEAGNHPFIETIWNVGYRFNALP